MRIVAKPAIARTRSPRAYLLKRLGLDTIREKPTSMDMDFLAEEKTRLLDFLRDKLALLGQRDSRLDHRATAV